MRKFTEESTTYFERTCPQMERSEDAIGVGLVCSGCDGFLHKQLESQQIALKIYFEQQEVWERNWMNLEMHTLLNTYFLKIDCDDFEGTSRTTQIE